MRGATHNMVDSGSLLCLKPHMIVQKSFLIGCFLQKVTGS